MREEHDRAVMAHILSLDAAERELVHQRLNAHIRDLRRQADELEVAAAVRRLTPEELAEARARSERDADGEQSNSEGSNDSNSS
jgi:hypothetical protein